MNLPNKITMTRLILSIIIIILLIFPFESAGITMPTLFVNEALVINIKYLIAGVLFIAASLTDYFDGKIARKRNLVTDFGKMLDAIADKVLVNSVLIILSIEGFIHPIIPVIIVARDAIVNAIKMVAGNSGNVVAASKLAKVKTACLMFGITLTLFYNLPFELVNLRIADMLLIIATVLSIVSAINYFENNKKYISQKNM